MDWSTLWSLYRNTTKETQEDILRQINLKEFLQSLAPKYQIEVMEHAPTEIIKEVTSVLSSYTKKRMKIETMFSMSEKMKQLLDRNGMVMK